MKRDATTDVGLFFCRLRAKNIKPNKKGSVAPYLISSFATLPFSIRLEAKRFLYALGVRVLRPVLLHADVRVFQRLDITTRVLASVDVAGVSYDLVFCPLDR